MAGPHPLSLPSFVDTIIIGNGPSALILSYILHGHIPSYDIHNPHPDPILHGKLLQCSNLVEIDLRPLTNHFASSLRYSTQALPINTLLDTLIRPNADTEIADIKSRLVWHHRPELAISHVVLGNASRPGGQWADNPVAASWDIGTLSYAEMLSLPGYNYADHYLQTHDRALPAFTRPSRREVADYLAAYPAAVGIEDSIFNLIDVDDVSRFSTGFLVGSPKIRCKNLVLASGTFSINIPPPCLLRPLVNLRSDPGLSEAPLLVIGSGFTAADIIISTPPLRGILHIFRWAPDVRPSPLRGCHRSAYPEYAGVYRRMKLAALNAGGSKATSPLMRKKSNPFFSDRDWDKGYEGLPNAEVVDVVSDNEVASVVIRLADGNFVERRVSGLEYVVGRRGSLSYLDSDLLAEVIRPHNGGSLAKEQGTDVVSGRSLREKAEIDLQVAPHLFILGSLTGDSLIRFAYGGCIYAAGSIIRSSKTRIPLSHVDGEEQHLSTRAHHGKLISLPENKDDEDTKSGVNGLPHVDTNLGRQRLLRPVEIEHSDIHHWGHPVDRRDGLGAFCGV